MPKDVLKRDVTASMREAASYFSSNVNGLPEHSCGYFSQMIDMLAHSFGAHESSRSLTG